LIRISLGYVYSLADSLEPLARLDGEQTLGDVAGHVYGAQAALDGLLNGSVFSLDLRTSRQAGEQLLATLRSATEDLNGDFQKKLAYRAYTIQFSYQAFKPVLLAELGVAPAYFVTRREAYDTISLLDDGAALFPASLRIKVPEAVYDVREAGKALAFELGNACGFHIFRATEAVLRRYYAKVTGTEPKPTIRNLGVYLNVLKQKNCGDEKVRAALKQLVDLHRNPLIHPDTVLTTEDAVTLIGMARSAISLMLVELPEQEQTTTSLGAMFEK